MNKKQPAPADALIGERIRMARNATRMTQEKLGQAIGVSFQQVQKYEKGTNRVAGSRLVKIAQILGVSVDWFVEGAEAADRARLDVDQMIRFHLGPDTHRMALMFKAMPRHVQLAMLRIAEVAMPAEVSGAPVAIVIPQQEAA